MSAPLTGPEGEAGGAFADGVETALADAGAEAGGWSVGVVLLDSAAGGLPATPASVAANAREASRDSTAIAYIGEFARKADAFSDPVLKEANLLRASPRDDDGEEVMAAVLDAIDAADEPSDRQSVADAFER